MFGNKKNFLFLLAIPVYVLTSFTDPTFTIAYVILFGVFTVCAAVMLALESKALKIMCITVLHLALIPITVFWRDFTGLTWHLLFVYCQFSLPPLLIMAMLNGANKQGENTVDKQKHTFFNKARLFELCIAVMFLVLIVLVLAGTESFKIGFDVLSVIAFVALLALLLFVYIILYMRDKLENIDERLFLEMLCVITVYDFLIDIVWANQYLTDTFVLAFPLTLTTVVVFKEYAFLKRLFAVLPKTRANVDGSVDDEQK